MSGQSHMAVLFVLVMLIIGVAAVVRTSDVGSHGGGGEAWVCRSHTDSLSCFLASLSH